VRPTFRATRHKARLPRQLDAGYATRRARTVLSRPFEAIRGLVEIGLKAKVK